MRNLIRRTAVLAGAAALLLGSGIGVAAAAPAPRSVTFDPSPLDFGTISVGVHDQRVLTVTNDGSRGTGPVTFRITGSRAAEFSVEIQAIPPRDRCVGGLGPGNSCDLAVGFTPAEAGAAAVTLGAFDNTGAEVGSATLTGTGMGQTLPCQVTNEDTSESFGSLSEALRSEDTDAGDTLLATGTCEGTVRITENLTITGQNGAILDGGGSFASVLDIGDGADVTLNTLTITNGNNQGSTGGGGILNQSFSHGVPAGEVILNGTTVIGNRASEEGGGINNYGTLILNDSTVTDNFSGAHSGGGIYNHSSRGGTVTLNGSSVHGNSPDNCVGFSSSGCASP